MANEAVRLRPCGLRRDKQVFFFLPRRNEMKPGHLTKHQRRLTCLSGVKDGVSD